MPEPSPNIPSQPVVLYDAAGVVVSNQTTGLPAVAAPAYAVQVGGTDGTNLRVLSVDTLGRLNVAVAGGGGGTQFADGAVRGTATGTLMMVDDGTNIQSASGDTSGRLNVNVVSTTLPTGAAMEATLAKQAIAQGTALGTNTMTMAGGSVTTAAPAYTAGQISPLSLDTAGNLRVTPSSSASTSPGTIGAGESSNNRAYQTTYEVTIGTTETNLLLFRNPVASGKKAYIRNIVFASPSNKALTVRVYSGPTVTANGTTLTPTSMNIGGGAATAVILVTTAPTTSARGTKLSVGSDLNEQAEIDYDWGLILQANTSMLISGQGGAVSSSLTINIIWSEAA